MAEPDRKPLSEDEFSRWWTPAKSLDVLRKATGNWEIAPFTVIMAAHRGKLAVHAEDIDREMNGQKHSFSRYGPVPDSVVKAWYNSGLGGELTLWQNGGHCEVEDHIPGSGLSTKARWSIFYIRFDPAGINKLAGIAPIVIPPAPPPSPAIGWERFASVKPTPPKNVGGAPPKGYWEAVWVQIAADIIKGKFDPKKQGDIQEAIERIVMDLGQTVGETAAKKHAKMLWEKIK